MTIDELSDIKKLSIPEKILLLEDLWDSIVPFESNISIPESHKNELDRRLQKHRKSPGDLLTLEQLQSGIEERK
jgi:putative addiction module component (TIGR02574 family)